VNREENACVLEEWFMTTARAQFYRSESTGPVVQVNDVRFVPNALKQSDGGATEEGKAFEIIRVAVNVLA
jgi:hypothetical protein